MRRPCTEPAQWFQVRSVYDTLQRVLIFTVALACILKKTLACKLKY
jgi:hypothetical protein